MTDQLDTDALRELTREPLPEEGGSSTDAWEADAVSGLFAAADEVDRLRAELEVTNGAARYQRRRAEGLQSVIENAPHAPQCKTWVQVNLTYRLDGKQQFTNPCTCWKANAL